LKKTQTNKANQGDYLALRSLTLRRVVVGCAKGDWTRAHEYAQQDEGMEGSWAHAYLHRKKGDQGNAAYWYSRAGKPVCREPLDEEWVSIVRALLE
jgi:hypothetical protein